jgi:putative methanogenesis marker protein 5
MSLYGPMIAECEAAIIIDNADLAFGCMGCARTNELITFLVRQKDIPKLDLNYPSNEEEGVKFVAAVRKFLEDLGKTGGVK